MSDAEERADRLNLWPGERAILVLDVEILRRRETPTGPVLSVDLPQELRADDFAEQRHGGILELAGTKFDVGGSKA